MRNQKEKKFFSLLYFDIFLLPFVLRRTKNSAQKGVREKKGIIWEDCVRKLIPGNFFGGNCLNPPPPSILWESGGGKVRRNALKRLFSSCYRGTRGSGRLKKISLPPSSFSRLPTPPNTLLCPKGEGGGRKGNKKLSSLSSSSFLLL